MKVSNCPVCGWDFIPKMCEEHCTNKCCRKAKCANVRQHNGTLGRQKVDKCMVCKRPAAEFERFAPCTKDCEGSVYFASSKGDPGTLGDGILARRWQSGCHLRDNPEGHRPSAKPRIHVAYCSLRCYNSLAFGHETRRLVGNRVRSRRYEGYGGGGGSRGVTPGWRNRWRQEQGYFRTYQQRRKMREDNIMRYGDGRSEAELRAAENLRLAALEDPDFMEIFGPDATG